MTSLARFIYDDRPVRVVTIDGEPWFVGADVARVLGIAAASGITRMVDDEDKGSHELETPGGLQSVTIVNESGLYTALMRSNNPAGRSHSLFAADVTRSGQAPALPLSEVSEVSEAGPLHPCPECPECPFRWVARPRFGHFGHSGHNPTRGRRQWLTCWNPASSAANCATWRRRPRCGRSMTRSPSFTVHDFTSDGFTDASARAPNDSLITRTWTFAWRTVEGRRVP